MRLTERILEIMGEGGVTETNRVRLWWYFFALLIAALSLILFFLFGEPFWLLLAHPGNYFTAVFHDIVAFFTAPPDFQQLLVRFAVFCVAVVVYWIFWELNVAVKLHERIYFVELSAPFFINFVLTASPFTALLAYLLGATCYEASLKHSIRSKLFSVFLNTFVAGFALLITISITSLTLADFSQPLRLLRGLSTFMAVCMLLTTLLAPLYIALMRNTSYQKLLNARFKTGKILVELIGVVVFPSMAFLALLIWRIGPSWIYQILSLVFLLSLTFLIQRGLKTYVWFLDTPARLTDALINILEKRDGYTARHSKKDAAYALALARLSGTLDENELDILEKETLEHDIGKLITPDYILLKKGKPSDEEFAVIKEHTQQELLLALLPDGLSVKNHLEVGLNHHEKHDGTGYPKKLKGIQIPAHVQFITPADIWDGMTSGRIYRRRGFTPEQTCAFLIAKCHRKWFSPLARGLIKIACRRGIFHRIIAEDPAHTVYAEEAHQKKDPEPPPKLKDSLMEIEGGNFFYRTRFSPARISLKIFLALIPTILGTASWFLPGIPIGWKLPLFFVGWFWMMETWQLQEPASLPSWVGDSAYLSMLLAFPFWEVLGIVTLVQSILCAFANRLQRRLIVGRVAVFLIATYAFSQLVGEQSLSSTHQVVGLAVWILVYAVLQYLALNVEAMLREKSSRLFLEHGPLLRFFSRVVLFYPVLGFTLYFLRTAPGFPFPLTFLCFLPLIVLLFIIYKLREEILKTTVRLFEVFAFFLAQKLGFTKWHPLNTARIAFQLARELRLNPYETACLMLAAFTHDIGAIAIEDQVYNTLGKLSTEEFGKIKTHPKESLKILGVEEQEMIPKFLKNPWNFLEARIKILKDIRPLLKQGLRILNPIGLYSDVQEIIYSHHERFDGGGYPRGLKGMEIPLGAAILAVADAVDALISPRPYHEACSLEEAAKIILANSGTQFTPQVATALVRIVQSGQLRMRMASELPSAASVTWPEASSFQERLFDISEKLLLEASDCWARLAKRFRKAPKEPTWKRPDAAAIEHSAFSSVLLIKTDETLYPYYHLIALRADLCKQLAENATDLPEQQQKVLQAMKTDVSQTILTKTLDQFPETVRFLRANAAIFRFWQAGKQENRRLFFGNFLEKSLIEAEFYALADPILHLFPYFSWIENSEESHDQELLYNASLDRALKYIFAQVSCFLKETFSKDSNNDEPLASPGNWPWDRIPLEIRIGAIAYACKLQISGTSGHPPKRLPEALCVIQEKSDTLYDPEGLKLLEMLLRQKLIHRIVEKREYTSILPSRNLLFVLLYLQALDLIPERQVAFMDRVTLGHRLLHLLGEIRVQEPDHARGYAQVKRNILDLLPNELRPKRWMNLARFIDAHWDGHGISQGLKGEGIPFKARVYAVSHEFNRLRSKSHDKHEKKEPPLKEVVEALQAEAGKRLDPQAVSKFIGSVKFKK